MTIFVELTDNRGSPVAVNASRVAFIMQYGEGGTCLHFMNGADDPDDRFLHVSENYEAVKRRLLNASA